MSYGFRENFGFFTDGLFFFFIVTGSFLLMSFFLALMFNFYKGGPVWTLPCRRSLASTL